MNLLLVDDTLVDLELFTTAVNENTKVVQYGSDESLETLTKKIADLSVVEFNVLGFAFVNEGSLNKSFVRGTSFVKYERDDKKKLFVVSNTTTEFIKLLVNTYNIKTIDFLGCSLLSDKNWEKYFAFIVKDNESKGVKVRASKDKTGNMLNGGDWILESTNDNIEKIYFTDKIKLWKQTLDSSNYTTTAVLTLEEHGNLYISGEGTSGEMGNGTTLINKLTNINKFIDTFKGKRVLDVAVSPNGGTLLITDEETDNLYCCGYANWGEHGLDSEETTTYIYKNVSTQSGLLSGKKIKKIACGYSHSAIIDSDNYLYTCGYNGYGELGLGNTDDCYNFTLVDDTNINTKAINVACGYRFTAVITSDAVNNLYTCGYNAEGQLGVNDTSSYDTFQNVTTNISGKKVKKIKCGYAHLAVLTKEETNNLYTCGYNNYGQLGVNSTVNKTTLQNINIDNKYVFDIACSEYAIFALTNKTVNNLFVSGYDGDNGIFGNEYWDTSFDTFTEITNDFKISSLSITTSSTSNFVVSSNKIWATGENNFGELSLGNYDNRCNYTRVQFEGVVSKVVTGYGTTLLITTEPLNNFYICGAGDNDTNFLGIVNTSIYNNVSVLNKHVLKVVTGEEMTLCITDDLRNNLYGCGHNYIGMLDQNSGFCHLSKFQSITKNILNKKIVDVACGENFFMVLTDELVNNLYACGANSFGQLGINSSCSKSELQNVGLSECSSLLNKRIIKIACGRDFSFALTDDGHLFATGRNDDGQLGLDSTCDKDKFTHVMCDVVDISAGRRHALLLTNELTNNLYSTGSNSDGQLGLNVDDCDLEYATTFRNVGLSTIIVDLVTIRSALLDKQVLNISCGRYSSFAVTSDSSNNLYSCGDNDVGQLGLDDTNNRIKFVNVAELLEDKKVVSVNAYAKSTTVITNENVNNLYGCGDYCNGQLGLNGRHDYVSRFQNIGESCHSGFSDKTVIFNNYKYNDVIYIDIPYKTTINTVTTWLPLTITESNDQFDDASSMISHLSTERYFTMLPKHTTFDKHVSFTIYNINSLNLKVLFKVPESSNHEDATPVLKDAKSNQIYYTLKYDIMTVYTKVFGELSIGYGEYDSE